jgi:uncharacterized protein (DUF58 family)
MNNKTLVVSLIIISLFIVALVARNGDIAWMMLPFLAYLMMGILQAPPREKLSFHAERNLDQTRANGIASIDVSLSVQNQALETVHVFINETAQEGMKITDGETSRLATLRPGESTELSYTFTAMRGKFFLEIYPGRGQRPPGPDRN